MLSLQFVYLFGFPFPWSHSVRLCPMPELAACGTAGVGVRFVGLLPARESRGTVLTAAWEQTPDFQSRLEES